jgi:hypothetical protein
MGASTAPTAEAVGYINYLDLVAGLRAGEAVAGSDLGHQAATGDGTWAKGHPEKVRDYGWCAVHLTEVVGKQLVTSPTDVTAAMANVRQSQMEPDAAMLLGMAIHVAARTSALRISRPAHIAGWR